MAEMMQIPEMEALLAQAVKLRPPRWVEERLPPAVKIRDIEDYLMETAWMQAELEEALFWLGQLVAHFKGRVEQIVGYEVALPKGKRTERITQADVLAAKRTIDPEVFDAGSRARALREGCLRQIERLRWEAGQGPISRAYTVITGG